MQKALSLLHCCPFRYFVTGKVELYHYFILLHIFLFENNIKYSCYRMLNRRDQNGKLRYGKYLRIWNYHPEFYR
jgi:hypothetical protein